MSRKCAIFWAILLALLLSAAGAVAEEGSQIILDMPPGTVFAVFEDDPSVGLHHYDVLHARIANFDRLRSMYTGEPQWHMECEEPGVTVEVLNSHGPSVDVSVSADHACEADVFLICVWNEDMQWINFHVSFINAASLPAGLNIPKVIDLAVGEDFRCEPSFLPADFEYVSPYNFEVRTSGGLNDQNCGIVTFSPSMLSAIFIQPGTYTVPIMYAMGNMAVEQDVVFQVSSGPEPVFRMEIEGPESEVFALFMDDPETGLHPNNEFRAVIRNFKEVRNQFSSEPEWKIIGGDQRMYAGISGAGNFASFWVDGHIPAEATLTVMCLWEGQVCTDQIHIRFERPANLPQDLTIPDEITLPLGQDYTGVLGFLPDSFQLGARREAGVDFMGDPRAVSRLDMGEAVTVTAQFIEPGDYPANVRYCTGNVLMEKQVVFHVTEPAQPPVFHMVIKDSHDEVFGIFADNTETGLRHNNFFQAVITNYKEVRKQFSGEPEWKLISNNAAVRADIVSASGDSLRFAVNADKPCEGDVTVMCIWEGQVWTDQLHIRFEPLKNPPTGLDIPDEITVPFGEVYEGALSFLPEDYLLGNRRSMNFSYPEHAIIRPVKEWPAFSAWFAEPGDYTVSVRSIMANMEMEKQVTFHVTGGAPTLHLTGNLSVIEEEAFAGTAAKRVVIDSAQRIESRAFADMPQLVAVTLPDNITFIADDAFDDNPNLIFICGQSAYARNWVNTHHYIEMK